MREYDESSSDENLMREYDESSSDEILNLQCLLRDDTQVLCVIAGNILHF